MPRLNCKACISLSLLPVLFGCSSIPRPTEQLEAARAAVQHAELVAQPEGDYELALAQGKLAGAARALQRGDHVGARILAEQAELDARYAWTLGENARLQRAAAALGRSTP